MDINIKLFSLDLDDTNKLVIEHTRLKQEFQVVHFLSANQGEVWSVYTYFCDIATLSWRF